VRGQAVDHGADLARHQTVQRATPASITADDAYELPVAAHEAADQAC
jgi:hypothetical protein